MSGTSISLAGQVALVAGGGGAIGGAVARVLLAAGAVVVTADREGHPGPPGTRSVACDLPLAAGAAAAVAGVEREGGRLDILVHCAGVTRDALLSKMTDEAWGTVLATNLDSAFYLLRSAAPVLRKAGNGCVVLVASINGERGKVGQANYAASKAGMIGLARTAARELGRHGTRVNAVAPGWIDTPMTETLTGEHRQRALDESVLGRLGRPEDVAGAVLFLCSGLALHITGQVLRVDGGQLIS